jgi:Skp family chaperone for outer membrane proteins
MHAKGGRSMLTQGTRESLANIQAQLYDPEHMRLVAERRRHERESLIRWLRQLEGQSERAAEAAKAEGRHKFAAKMRRVAVSCRARLDRLECGL